ncbi:hypothetical protein [Streptomyces sp. NPDC048845]
MGRARLAALHGVATSYEPSPGRTLDVPEDTVVAVLAAPAKFSPMDVFT